MGNNNEHDMMKETKYIIEERTNGCYIKARHVLAIMGFLGILNSYLMRMNLSIAIVAMVNYTGNIDDEVSINTTIAASGNGSSTNSNPSNGMFNWNMVEQGIILGCFYYGNIVSNLPGAILAKKFGVKLVLCSTMMFSSILTLVSPIVAKSSFALFVVLRICLGLAQGPILATIQGAWGYWAPPNERSSLSSAALSGTSFGMCVVYPLGGFLSEYFGWESVFYCTGLAAFLWTCACLLLVYNTPAEHPRISEQERRYIIESIGMEKKNETMITTIPWAEVLRSLPVFGLMAGHFAFVWNYLMLVLLLPTYMATILKFNLSSNGIFSALPFLLQGILTYTVGYITDKIRQNGLTPTGRIRKINATIGCFIPALFLVLVGYVGADVTAAVAFFCISIAFQSFNVSGVEANAIDIAPRYAGVIFGLSNTISNSSGFIAPAVVGLMLVNQNSIQQWRSVFWISAAINVTGLLVFILLASGEEQPWAKGKQKVKEVMA